METKIQYSKIVGNLLKILPKRYQNVLARRYGLKRSKPETLESIGRDYKITRERVRQIEEAALKQVKNSEEFQGLDSLFVSLGQHLGLYGGLRKESEFFAELTGSSRNFPHLNCLLELSGRFQKVPEDYNFHAFWFQDKEALERAKRALDALIGKLREKGSPHSEKEFNSLYKNELPLALGEQIEESALQSYLAVTKEICRGPFGHFGLRQWPEINPRGIKDKAYLVLKREGRPLHFRDVCNLINRHDFPRIYLGAWRQRDDNLSQMKRRVKRTNHQTVHNELIKDQRFVLVGRGLYALSEWGYARGVVKDIIRKVLTEAGGSLRRDEVITAVLKQRMVKPATVLCNLQDRKLFRKSEDGAYSLVA